MEKPPTPEPPQEELRPFKPPSQFFKLSRRLSQKTTIREPVSPTKAAQEAVAMPPPDIPKPRESAIQLADQAMEQESHASSYASLEQPTEEQEEEETSPAAKRSKRWAYFTPTPSASETEMGPESLDLQSHDPRPESVVIAQWAQGLGAPTASTADMEQPVLTKPLTLLANEQVREAGQSIDSTLQFKYDVNETHRDQEFRTPRRLLIIKAPTGSGKTTVYPALAARALPKRFGRVRCTQVRRATRECALEQRKCGVSMKTIRSLDSNMG